MKFNYPYLKDKDFLKEIDLAIVKEHFVRINILDWDERYIDAIEGRATGGSINLDGKSAVRRTASISLVADDGIYDIMNTRNLISINKKIAIEIGLLNTTYQYLDYPIIWFPQGIFVINSASISKNNSGLNISVSAKDKMCLLNGDCGGTFAASVEFHLLDTTDPITGETISERPTMYSIIQSVVHDFGGEALDKIIINDLSNRVKRVMKWVGNTPVYYLIENNSATLSTEKKEGATEIVYGQDIGYIYENFYYPSDLVAKAGDSIVSILDKVKNALGNFEYFYDIEGNFIFQEIKNYLNTSYPESLGDYFDYRIDLSSGKSVYSFEDGQLITSYSNSPQYNMIKNDFVIWGAREGVTGNKLPIRYHLAIDVKPQTGNSYTVYIDRNASAEMEGLAIAKWIMNVFDLSNIVMRPGVVYYSERDNGYYELKGGKEVEVSALGVKTITTSDWRSELYLQGIRDAALGLEPNYYYAELVSEWPKLYDIETGEFLDQSKSDIDFFLDFIEPQTALTQSIQVNAIGRRTKTIEDDSIDTLFAPEIPDYVLIETGREDTAALRSEANTNGQNYIQVSPGLYSSIAASSGMNSAFENIRMQLHEYTSYNENISITVLPIYYLEPNTRVTVEDEESGIHGDYIIQSFSLPLTYNGTMTLSCKKALERY